MCRHVTTPRCPMKTRQINRHDNITRPHLPLLGTTLYYNLGFFLLRNGLYLPANRFPANRIVKGLLLDRRRAAEHYVRAILRHVLTTLLRLKRRPRGLYAIQRNWFYHDQQNQHTAIHRGIRGNGICLVPSNTSRQRFTTMNHPNSSLNIRSPRIFPTTTTPNCSSLINPTTFIRLSGNVYGLLHHLGTLRVSQTRRGFYHEPTPAGSVTGILRYHTNLTNSSTSTFKVHKRQLFILYHGGSLLLRLNFRLLGDGLHHASTIQRRLISVSLRHTIPLVRDDATSRSCLRTLFQTRTRPPHVQTRRRHFSANTNIPRERVAITTTNILCRIYSLTPRHRVRRSIVYVRRHLSVLVRNQSNSRFDRDPTSHTTEVSAPVTLSLRCQPNAGCAYKEHYYARLQVVSLLVAPPTRAATDPKCSF